MKYVYKLEHRQKIEPDGEGWICDSKTIGYFSSIEKAKKVIYKYREIIGFKDYPNCFYIIRVEIDFDDYDFV